MTTLLESKPALAALEEIYKAVAQVYPDLLRPYYGMAPEFQRLDWIANYTDHTAHCDGCVLCGDAPIQIRDPAFYENKVLPLLVDMRRYNAWQVLNYVGDYLWLNYTRHFEDPQAAAVNDLILMAHHTAGEVFQELYASLTARYQVLESEVDYIPHHFRTKVYYNDETQENQ